MNALPAFTTDEDRRWSRLVMSDRSRTRARR
jgi:hypothetical protein